MVAAIIDKDFYTEVASKVVYDKDTGAFEWRGSGNPCTSKDVGGYLRLKYKGRTVKLHRLAYFIHTGEVPTIIDHINRVKDDNRIENLRQVNGSHNAINRVARKEYKGVTFVKTHGKWSSRIMYQNRRHLLGYFDSAIEAARAYDKKAKELFGNYAYVNFKDNT